MICIDHKSYMMLYGHKIFNAWYLLKAKASDFIIFSTHFHLHFVISFPWPGSLGSPRC